MSLPESTLTTRVDDRPKPLSEIVLIKSALPSALKMVRVANSLVRNRDQSCSPVAASNIRKPSAQLTATRLPSALNERAPKKPLYGDGPAMVWPVSGSHTRVSNLLTWPGWPQVAEVSLLSVTTRLEAGANQAAWTFMECFRGKPAALPLATSHTCAVLWSLMVRNRFSSSLKVGCRPSVHQSSIGRPMLFMGPANSLPSRASQKRRFETMLEMSPNSDIGFSLLNVRKYRPLLLNCAPQTGSKCGNSLMSVPEATSQMRADLSSLAVITCLPSGLK